MEMMCQNIQKQNGSNSGPVLIVLARMRTLWKITQILGEPG
jgi:hypothetical protein